MVYNNVVLFLYSNVLHSHGMARLLNCLVSGFDSLMDILPFPQLSVGLTSFSSYSVTMPFIYNLVHLDQFTGNLCASTVPFLLNVLRETSTNVGAVSLRSWTRMN